MCCNLNKNKINVLSYQTFHNKLIRVENNNFDTKGLQENAGTCKFELTATDQPQNFTTTGFPFPYPPNTNCIWSLKSSDNTTLIDVTMEELYTEPCCDFLDVSLFCCRLNPLKGSCIEMLKNNVENLQKKQYYFN